MKKSRFTDQQIAFAPQQAEAGTPVAEVCRKMGVSRTGVRAERLDQAWFMDLDDARRKVEDWRVVYNEVRPHSAIGDRPPMALLAKALDPSEAAAEPGALT